MEKKCFVCGVVKPLDSFYRHKRMNDGHLNKCKECVKEYARSHRRDRSVDLERYRTNPERYLGCKYSMMKTRCNGGGHSTYAGRELLSKEEWKMFCENTKEEFMRLYTAWQNNGFAKRLAPSIDRVDNDRGYTTDNMRWVTQSENSSKKDRPF